MILGYELGNSCKEIPASTWEHDGVLSKILGPAMEEIRSEYGGTGPVSAEEALALIHTLVDRSASENASPQS